MLDMQRVAERLHDEIERLKGELEAVTARCDRCCEATEQATNKLQEATKAGTAYWHERETTNNLVLENERLKARLAEVEGRKLDVDRDELARAAYDVHPPGCDGSEFSAWDDPLIEEVDREYWRRIGDAVVAAIGGTTVATPTTISDRT